MYVYVVRTIHAFALYRRNNTNNMINDLLLTHNLASSRSTRRVYMYKVVCMFEHQIKICLMYMFVYELIFGGFECTYVRTYVVWNKAMGTIALAATNKSAEFIANSKKNKRKLPL